MDGGASNGDGDGSGRGSLPPKLALQLALRLCLWIENGEAQGHSSFYTKGPLVPVGITNRD
jgi:hypothetical protein